MKICQFCAEEIRSEAVYCRYCRSHLASRDGVEWFRGHPDARLAGVCAALAHAFAIPVGMVRLLFVLFTVFIHVGLFAYVGLWLLIPSAAGEPSHAERALKWSLDLVRGADVARDRDIARRGNSEPAAGGKSDEWD